MEKPLAIPLLSGGMDSGVAALIAKENYPRMETIFINWRHVAGEKRSHTSYEKEIRAARKISDILGSELYEIEVPFRWYAEEKVLNEKAWPYARNLIFLSLAASYATTKHYGNNNIIFTGFNTSDAGGKDASPKFVEAFNEVIKRGIHSNMKLEKVKVEAPLLGMNKTDIIKYAYDKGAGDIIENSWSCYKNLEKHCGTCANCEKRKEAFQKAGIDDPTGYLE